MKQRTLLHEVSIKGNALRARASGVPVNARLVAVYTLAAAIAGRRGIAPIILNSDPKVERYHRPPRLNLG